MKRFLLFFLLSAVLILCPTQSSADKAPHKIAGFVLGDKIASCADLVRMGTVIPIRDQLYLQVVEIKDLEGYKSGAIAFGECADPGRIVRIKLKYALSDKDFFNELLDRFKQRFGEPHEWRGDPFHVIIAWKWSFRDQDNNKISMVLQHSRDEEQKWGNSVKLTNTTLIEKERACYKKNHPGQDESSGSDRHRKLKLKDIDFQRFIPE